MMCWEKKKKMKNQTDDYGFCKSYLKEDEYVVWTGKPGRGNLFVNVSRMSILFSTIWTVVLLLFLVVLIRDTSVDIGKVFLLCVLLVICFYVLFGRFLMKAIRRNRFRYVVTNKKIITKCDGKVSVYTGKYLPPMETEAYKNGMVTIVFSRMTYDEHGVWGRVEDCRLENLEDYKGAKSAISMIRCQKNEQ